MHSSHNSTNFTQGEITDAIQIWNSSAISLLDIRHSLISPDDALQNYRLPTSAFLFTCGKKVEVHLGSTAYQTERFGLFHGGKGTELSIYPQENWLEYYMILYKAGEPTFLKREYARLLERTNPFRYQYGFVPQNPLFFVEQLRKMYERWKGPSPLNLFYEKTKFYQLIYEVYEALEQGTVQIFEPDVVAMAQRYLDKHFCEDVVIQELCAMLDVGYSSFYRSFKQKTGVTPQEYLISTRLDAAKQWLTGSSASIREVSEHCGFPDERNFYRQFIKNVGVSPSAYRQISHTPLQDNTIEKLLLFPYNEQGQVSLGKLKDKGATSMLRQMKSKAIFTASLSLMLALSACGAPAASSSVDSAAATSQAVQVEESAPVQEGTRIVSTVMGDVEVPVSPQRVVVNWYIGEVVSAGLNVVGYSCWAQETMPYYDLMMESTKITEWEPETVMALEPDLIVTYDKEDFEKFSKVAPVLVIEESTSSPDRTKFLGEATGNSEIANKNVEVFETKLTEAKEIFKGEAFEGKTFSIMEDWGPSGEWNGVAYETGSRGGTLIYKYLGLTYPQKLTELIQSSGQGRGTISYETAHEYFGDYILWFQQVDTESEYAKTDIWKSIPAVVEGRVLEIPGQYQGLFYYDDVLSLTSQLDYLVEKLNAFAN